MSNVKVNGNTYNSVTSIKLMKADDSGYAEYTEGASGKDWLDVLMNSDTADSVGDITREDIYFANLSILAKRTVGTISFPNATKMRGNLEGVKADNILLPKVAEIISNVIIGRFSMYGATVSGVVDLGTGGYNNTANQMFMGAAIGTLKIGKINPHNGLFQNATITNLVWNNPDIPVGDGNSQDSMTGLQGLNCVGTKITNAYVPDEMYDGIKALMDAGTVTTVTNLYKISEWSDE